MKSKGNKVKKPIKLKHCIVHVKFESKQDLENLELIKKLTGANVATKAVNEALLNYPQLVKKSDSLNTELMKVNREFENQSYKFDTVKRAFAIINETEIKP